MRQFPSRLVATSWDLADTPGGRVVGFSGEHRDAPALVPLLLLWHRGRQRKDAVLLGSRRAAMASLRASDKLHRLAQAQLAACRSPTAPAGTNDSHCLLPLQVRQQLKVEQGMRATNGRMLGVLLANPRYDTLEPAAVSTAWPVLAGAPIGGP